MRARVTVRLDLAPGCRVGPGKVRLLEAITVTGSIAAAGRTLGMSYKRAWDLVDELNRSFREAVVVTHVGGRDRGGAQLTAQGRALVAHYRAIEAEAERAAADGMAALGDALAAPAEATGDMARPHRSRARPPDR